MKIIEITPLKLIIIETVALLFFDGDGLEC